LSSPAVELEVEELHAASFQITVVKNVARERKELSSEIALFSFVYVKLRRKFILKQMAYGSAEYSDRS